jgi:hypothetical protein
VPENVKGQIKVVGTLEGWPFEVEADPTVLTVGEAK